VFGRFEAASAHDRWVGDALHGSKIAGRKPYLFCFMDDHSRTADPVAQKGAERIVADSAHRCSARTELGQVTGHGGLRARHVRRHGSAARQRMRRIRRY
jgi:hypothetical protein